MPASPQGNKCAIPDDIKAITGAWDRNSPMSFPCCRCCRCHRCCWSKTNCNLVRHCPLCKGTLLTADSCCHQGACKNFPCLKYQWPFAGAPRAQPSDPYSMQHATVVPTMASPVRQSPPGIILPRSMNHLPWTQSQCHGNCCPNRPDWRWHWRIGGADQCHCCCIHVPSQATAPMLALQCHIHHCLPLRQPAMQCNSRAATNTGDSGHIGMRQRWQHRYWCEKITMATGHHPPSLTRETYLPQLSWLTMAWHFARCNITFVYHAMTF